MTHSNQSISPLRQRMIAQRKSHQLQELTYLQEWI
jgi:hypothetical protein